MRQVTDFMGRYSESEESAKTNSDWLVDYKDINEDHNKYIPNAPILEEITPALDRLVFKKYAWGIVYERTAIQRAWDPTLEAEYLIAWATNPWNWNGTHLWQK